MSRYCVKVTTPRRTTEILSRYAGLSFRQAYPGGFSSCQLAIPGKVEYPPYSRLTVTKGPVVVWDGEIGDCKYESTGSGWRTGIDAYGFGAVLQDDLFGPRCYRDTRTKSWRVRDRYDFGNLAHATGQEKFDLTVDDTTLRIAPKAAAVFRGKRNGGVSILADWGQDFGGFWYDLPDDGTLDSGSPTTTIAQITFNYDLNVGGGAWELVVVTTDLVIFETHSIAITTGVGSAVVTPTNPANPVAAGIFLRAKQDQAANYGVINDGAAESIGHQLIYSGDGSNSHWYPDLNDGSTKFWHHEGGMITQNNAASVQTDKGGQPFWPDGTTLTGAITDSATSLTVASATDFPTGATPFTIWIDAEQLTVTAVAGTTWTVTRGANGTTATAHASGAVVRGKARIGGAARLRFTGREIEWYAETWGSFGNTEYRIYQPDGTLVTSGTIDLYSAVRAFQVKVLDYALPAFGGYILTLRNLGTSTANPSPPAVAQSNVDYFATGVRPVTIWEDGGVYAAITNPVVKTTTATIDAARVAQDIVALWSGAEHGLSASTIHINEAGTALPAHGQLVYDDPVNALDALLDVIATGTDNDLPIGFGIWEDKMLVLEEYGVGAGDGWYAIDPATSRVSFDTTTREGFVTTVAPLYRDAEGRQRVGADVVSGRVDTEYSGRQKRIALRTDDSGADAAVIAATYLRNRDRPIARARVATKGPIRDRGGAIVPPDEVRAGRVLRVAGYTEWGQMATDDRRAGFAAVIVGTEYDTESGTLTIELGDGGGTYERLIAQLKRRQDREAIRA